MEDLFSSIVITTQNTSIFQMLFYAELIQFGADFKWNSSKNIMIDGKPVFHYTFLIKTEKYHFSRSIRFLKEQFSLWILLEMKRI